MDDYFFIYIILGFTVLALSIYLGFLYSKIRIQNKQIQAYQEEYEVQQNKKQTEIVESVEFIAKAFVQGQCEASEACLRIKKLIDKVPHFDNRSEINAVHEMFKEIEKFPFLEERQKLSKQEIFDQDKERFQIEDKYKERLKFACEQVVAISKSFPRTK